MPMQGTPQFANIFGEVQDEPTANTILGRSKAIETAMETLSLLSIDIRRVAEELQVATTALKEVAERNEGRY